MNPRLIVTVSAIIILTVYTNTVFAEKSVYKFTINNKEYEIAYEITNAEMKNVTLDPALTLILKIETNPQKDGFLRIGFPEEFFADLIGPLCAEDEKIILIDGEEHDYKKSKQGNVITYEFDIPAKSETIEIIGTTVIGTGANNRILGLPESINIEAGEELNISGIFTGYCGKPIKDESLLEKASFKVSTNIPLVQTQVVKPDKDAMIKVNFTVPNDTKPGSYEILVMNAIEGLLPVYEKIPVVITESLKSQDSLNDLKLLNNAPLIRFDEKTNELLEICCVSLAINPDGSMIAYNTHLYNDIGTIEYDRVWLYDINNKTSIEVDINRIRGLGFLSFSPDGTKLLVLGCDFEHVINVKGIHVIALSNALGLPCSELTNVRSADWLPDGSFVIARNIDNKTSRFNISLFERDGTEKVLYSSNDPLAFLRSVRTSPDGAKTAFDWHKVPRENYVVYEIFVLDLESGNVEKVVENGLQPRWSHDGKFLIYKEVPQESIDQEFTKNNPLGIIKMVDIVSKETVTLVRPDNGMGFYDLVLSPDGRKIIYSLYKNVYEDGIRKEVSVGIYSAEFNKRIPEFPVNLMLISATGLIGALIALRFKRNIVLR